MTTPYIISTPQPPVGTVYPFIGGGTTIGGTNPGDPNGWVLCDGQPRSAPTGDNERYTALAPLLNAYLGVIGNTGSSITPPNFTSRMALGNTGTSPMVMATGGTGGVMLRASDIPELTITVGGKHRHNVLRRTALNGGVRPILINLTETANTVNTAYNTTGVTNAKHDNEYYEIPQTAASLLNNYSTVNYIMKY